MEKTSKAHTEKGLWWGGPQACPSAWPIGNFPRLQNPDPILKTTLFLPPAILVWEQVVSFDPSCPPRLGTHTTCLTARKH